MPHASQFQLYSGRQVIKQMEDTIKEINSLQRDTEELKGFLYVLESGNVQSSYSTNNEIKMNEFSLLSLGARCWTGTQKSENYKTIRNREVINKFKNFMIEIVKQEIEILNLKLKELIKYND